MIWIYEKHNEVWRIFIKMLVFIRKTQKIKLSISKLGRILKKQSTFYRVMHWIDLNWYEDIAIMSLPRSDILVVIILYFQKQSKTRWIFALFCVLSAPHPWEVVVHDPADVAHVRHACVLAAEEVCDGLEAVVARLQLVLKLEVQTRLRAGRLREEQES